MKKMWLKLELYMILGSTYSSDDDSFQWINEYYAIFQNNGTVACSLAGNITRLRRLFITMRISCPRLSNAFIIKTIPGAMIMLFFFCCCIVWHQPSVMFMCEHLTSCIWESVNEMSSVSYGTHQIRSLSIVYLMPQQKLPLCNILCDILPGDSCSLQWPIAHRPKSNLHGQHCSLLAVFFSALRHLGDLFVIAKRHSVFNMFSPCYNRTTRTSIWLLHAGDGHFCALTYKLQFNWQYILW